MINILRAPDDIKIECEADNADCTVETEIKDEKLYVFISAAVARPRFICLRWNYRVTEPTYRQPKPIRFLLHFRHQ